MSNTMTFALAKGQLVSFPIKKAPLTIACVSGRLWATIDGSALDYIVGQGENISLTRRGTVVVQALYPASFHVATAASAQGAQINDRRAGDLPGSKPGERFVHAA
ncbi:MAG TPA: DUF2917 domain-containing protein [Spirochaetia bacterium]|nr:DUF2917 domain-containing protein [Spirochaetia bacterium]